jgi:cytidine deaminase
MKKHNVSFRFTEYENETALTASDMELVSAAKKATERAYAPYSRFNVGAAVRLESGRIITGSNVENAAFPSGICAERAAISNAVSNFPGDRITVIAIAAGNSEGLIEENVSPCGNCRQVIAEEETRNGNKVRLLLAGKTKVFEIDSISDLLPLQFNKDFLRVALP